MPPDRVQLSREPLVAEGGERWPLSERERLLAGILQATAQLGYRDVEVQDVLDRAGLSRPVFYEHFESREDCFLAAFDAAAGRLRDRLEAAAGEGGERWRERVRMGLEELLRWVTAEPDAVQAMVVEARAASPAALLRRDDLLDHFAGCVDSQARKGGAVEATGLAAAAVVGGIDALLYARLTKGAVEDLESLLPSLMYFTVLPYEGHEAACEELGAGAKRRPAIIHWHAGGSGRS